MRFSSICFLIYLIISLQAKSQNVSEVKVIEKYPAVSGAQTTAPDSSIVIKQKSFLNPFLQIPVKTVPGTYYKSTLGFFCKKELELEKKLNVSVKFRLGSLEYTDKMEGKGTGTRNF